MSTPNRENRAQRYDDPEITEYVMITCKESGTIAGLAGLAFLTVKAGPRVGIPLQRNLMGDRSTVVMVRGFVRGHQARHGDGNAANAGNRLKSGENASLM